jgi:glutathione S-transferase
MLAFDMSDTKFKFKEINHIKPVVKTMKDYQVINPLGNIPMIEDGHFRAIGGDVVIYIFVCKNQRILG